MRIKRNDKTERERTERDREWERGGVRESEG